MTTLAPVLLAVPLAAAQPAEVPAVYARTVELVETLYLEPESVTPEAMLHAAGSHLSERLDWLKVEPSPGGLRLVHGSDEEIGFATVTNWSDLPAALYAVETAVRASGQPLGDLDPRYVTLNGATTALDRFSRVLVGDGLDRFDARLRGTLVGIGARLRFVDDELTIVGLFADGPAERAGLLAGDRVLRIDGVPTAAMPINEAVRRIRGDAGSEVRLLVQRPGAAPPTFELPLTRAEVVVPNVVHEVLPGGVAYVRIDSISQKTLVNLRQSAAELRAAGAADKGLVLDLRGNGGGSMKESAAVVDLLVGEGLLLTTAGRDGRPVPNLLDRIEGRRTGDELDAPVVVLVDPRTASGAEIIAGALVEHGRAVLVGQRTYGKGRVQKLYDLDSASRLKLTVAEYVLANGRRVGGEGLVADLVVGRVGLDGGGLRLGEGWDLSREGVRWDDVLPVLASDPPAGAEDGEAVRPGDTLVELARRTVLGVSDRSRDALLASLRAAAAAVRDEEDRRIGAALSQAGLDWSAAPGPGGRPEVVVRAELAPSERPEQATLRVTLENHGPTTLHRTIVRTSSRFGPWNAWAVPLGAVAAGATAHAEVAVRLPYGLPTRQDVVTLSVHADRRPVVGAGSVQLLAPATPATRLGVVARLVEDAGRDLVRITLTNLTDRTLDDVEAELAWPFDLDVELLDRGGRTPSLVPRATATFDFAVRLGPAAPSSFPLRLNVDVGGEGRVLSWEVPLRQDGRPVDLAAPVVDLRAATSAAAPGTVPVQVLARDEGRLTSLVVYANGEKVTWSPGGQGTVALRPTVTLREGVNVLTVRAVDDEGIATKGTWTVLGVTDGLTTSPGPADGG